MGSVCEQYQIWVQGVVDEWDGQDTKELFDAILDRLGQNWEDVLEK